MANGSPGGVLHAPLALQLQALSGSLRCFLGPEPLTKAVVDPCSDSRCVIASRPQPFLLAAATEPTATTLLLDALDQQVGCPYRRDGNVWVRVGACAPTCQGHAGCA